jgi:hypothetical protein
MAGGLLLVGLVEIFHRVSPYLRLPVILDFLIAPGFIPMLLFYPDGAPPTQLAAFNRQWLIIGYVFNFVLYTAIVYLIFWWRDRRRARKQFSGTSGF